MDEQKPVAFCPLMEAVGGRLCCWREGEALSNNSGFNHQSITREEYSQSLYLNCIYKHAMPHQVQ